MKDLMKNISIYKIYDYISSIKVSKHLRNKKLTFIISLQQYHNYELHAK